MIEDPELRRLLEAESVEHLARVDVQAGELDAAHRIEATLRQTQALKSHEKSSPIRVEHA